MKCRFESCLIPSASSCEHAKFQCILHNSSPPLLDSKQLFADLHFLKTVNEDLMEEFNEVLVGGRQLATLLPHSGYPLECFFHEQIDELGALMLVSGPYLSREEQETL